MRQGEIALYCKPAAWVGTDSSLAADNTGVIVEELSEFK